MKATVRANVLEDGQEKTRDAAIAQESGLSVKTVRNLIDKMRKDNILVRIGPDKGGYWQLLK